MTIFKAFGLALLLCLIFIISPHPTYAQNTIPRFEPITCPFDTPPDETIDCGYLIVPENRSRPDSASTRIFVAIVKSHRPDPALDPIIYLRGGMDADTQYFIEQELSQANAWLAQRDLILFDKRGMGRSQPNLNCPEMAEPALQERLGVDLSIDEQVTVRLICHDRWLQQGIDLTGYNTFEIAADVADLWQVLGYEQVNLIGSSFWTIVAQLVMRDHGNSSQIRSVVLDSPVPVSFAAMAQTPAELNASMARLFAECNADLLCRMAYPNLEQVYRQVIDRLAASPVIITATNPLNGTPFSFEFGNYDFGYFIQYGAYPQLPQIIYDIYDGDYTYVIDQRKQMIRTFSEHDASADFGMRITRNCNEPWNTISPEQRAAMAHYPEAIFMDSPLDDALCARWSTFDVGEQTQPTGDIPTLILTAGYDTRLPASMGQLIAEPLSHSYHYHVPGAYHANLAAAGPCPDLMILEFFNDPSQSPNSDCLASAGPSRFDTEFVIRAVAARQPVQGLMMIMGVFLMGLTITAGIGIARNRVDGLKFGIAWQQSLRGIGWRSLAVSAGMLLLSIYATQTNLLHLPPTSAIALTLPIIVAIHAAFAFSPEDEPALEVMLAAPRPLAWTLLERLGMLFGLQMGVGLVATIALSYFTGEPVALAVTRWLPLVFFFSGIAVGFTLATRRAIFGVLLVCLLWIVLALFGDFMVERWPVAWPLHVYLSPSHAPYILNRLFITLLGLSLLGLSATLMLHNTERILLGRHKRQKTKHRLSTSRGTTLSAAASFHSHPVAITQLIGMLRYEFRLQWRRAALPALVVGLVMTPAIGVFISQHDFQGYREAVANGTLALEVAQIEITATMLPIIWIGVILMTMLMIPLLVADTIPKDKQIGVRELLDALPLNPAIYLTGKLLSLWLSLLVAIGITAAIAGTLWWLLAGPFNVLLFLEVWFVAATLLTFINGGSSMLLAAGQPTTRRAIAIGGFYALLCLIALGFSFTIDAGWWRWFNPARPAIMLYYVIGFPGATLGRDDWDRAISEFVQQVATQQDLFFSFAAGLLQVALLWLIVWQWLKRRRI